MVPFVGTWMLQSKKRSSKCMIFFLFFFPLKSYWLFLWFITRLKLAWPDAFGPLNHTSTDSFNQFLADSLSKWAAMNVICAMGNTIVCSLKRGGEIWQYLVVPLAPLARPLVLRKWTSWNTKTSSLSLQISMGIEGKKKQPQIWPTHFPWVLQELLKLKAKRKVKTLLWMYLPQ